MPSDCGRINQAADRWQDQPGSRLVAGSTRQQTVGRINHAADRGDGYEDKDKDEGENEDEDEDEDDQLKASHWFKHF